MSRLWIYSTQSFENQCVFSFCFLKIVYFQRCTFLVLAGMVFGLSVTLDFFVDLLCAERELAVKRTSALGRSCALSELSKFPTFLQDFFFQFLYQFSFKALKICSF
ncbi:hypothetical protein HKD37_02G005637 [Glycine soja]